jgi:hypothetical protein
MTFKIYAQVVNAKSLLTLLVNITKTGLFTIKKSLKIEPEPHSIDKLKSADSFAQGETIARIG